MIANEQLASNFYSLLKYFHEYCKTTKIFLSNIFSNEIISDENFPDYGIITWYQDLMMMVHKLFHILGSNTLWLFVVQRHIYSSML